MSFVEAYRRTMINEGEGTLTIRKEDPGGLTYSGISRVHWPEWEGWAFIDSGMISEANKLVERFYQLNFWNQIAGDNICQISKEIAYKVFDVAVNTSVYRGSKIMQRAMNLLNRNQKDYNDVVEDGIIGDRTLAALRMCLFSNPEQRLLKLMGHLQAGYYIEIMERYPEREEFRGWFERA